MNEVDSSWGVTLQPSKFSWFCCLLLAGCASPGAPDAGEDNVHPNDDQLPTLDIITNQTAVEGWTEPVWNGCTGWDSRYGVPHEMGKDGRVPSGWNTTPEDPTYQYDLYVLQCDRFHLGSLERGPVTFLFEMHNRYTPPEACVRNFIGTHAAVHAVYIDDAEIVQASVSQLGWPGLIAEFRQQGVSPLERQWSWRTEEGDWSWTRLASSHGIDQHPSFVSRQFWESEGILYVMDHKLSLTTSIGDAAALAHYAEPMLMADGRLPFLPVRAVTFHEATVESNTLRYRDALCEQPF